MKRFSLALLLMLPFSLRAALDVTVTGEASDGRLLSPDPLPEDSAFTEVFSHAADGTVEAMVAKPVSTLGDRDRLPLLAFVSGQAALAQSEPLPVGPLIVATPAAGETQWEVVDQSLTVVYRANLDKGAASWDGYVDDKFLWKAGETYTPVFHHPAGQSTRRRYGAPVRYPALAYRERGIWRAEFSNRALFGRGSGRPVANAQSAWLGALETVRRAGLKTCFVRVFFKPSEESLARQRLESLLILTATALEASPGAVKGEVAPAGARGDVSQIELVP